MATLGFTKQGDKQSDSQRIVQYDELGTLLFKKSKRVRRLSIVVKADATVVINMPYYVSYSEAETFVLEKAAWIKRTRVSVAKKQTAFDSYTEFTTRFRKLRLIPEERTNVHLKVDDEFMNVHYPKNVSLNHPAVQEIIRSCVEHTWKIEAHELLPNRVKELARQYGFRYKKLNIKANRSCWGSCTYDNIINLSLHLMRMPDELVDYVILHELCHTVHKNHGDGFWHLLDSVTGGKAKALSKRTQQYNPRII